MTNKDSNKPIRPLIKWTGGKYEEFPKFASYIPPFERYFEPFFGGGGVFFALQHTGASFVNDRSEDLITFYRSLSNKEFRNEMFRLVEAWENVDALQKDFLGHIIADFEHYLLNVLPLEDICLAVDRYFDSKNCTDYLGRLHVFAAIDMEAMRKQMRHSAKDKFRRIKRIADREQRVFSAGELADHVETALRSGFYMYIRDLMNRGQQLRLKEPTRTAAWYFIRELCYASMFRFNAKGEFNIPYGGIAYNRKNLRAKVDALFREEVQQLFANCHLYNLDFETFLDDVRPQEGDFIFLDPPYDSEFSEYDQNAFTPADQVRLRDCLNRQSAAWMMVIKETPFIRGIYEEIGAHFVDFDKTYLYNVRGRNRRDTKHLIITNYVPRLPTDAP